MTAQTGAAGNRRFPTGAPLGTPGLWGRGPGTGARSEHRSARTVLLVLDQVLTEAPFPSRVSKLASWGRGGRDVRRLPICQGEGEGSSTHKKDAVLAADFFFFLKHDDWFLFS